MKLKDKYGLDFLYFYRLKIDSSSYINRGDLTICSTEKCSDQEIFNSKDGKTRWKNFILDDNDLEMTIKSLSNNPFLGPKIFFIDMGKFYGNIDELKRDALIYQLSGLGKYNG